MHILARPADPPTLFTEIWTDFVLSPVNSYYCGEGKKIKLFKHNIVKENGSRYYKNTILLAYIYLRLDPENGRQKVWQLFRNPA